MLATFKAVVKNGRIVPLEAVELVEGARLLVTILADGESYGLDFSLVGSIELLDDDLETASREIAASFNESLDKSAKDLLK